MYTWRADLRLVVYVLWLTALTLLGHSNIGINIMGAMFNMNQLQEINDAWFGRALEMAQKLRNLLQL